MMRHPAAFLALTIGLIALLACNTLTPGPATPTPRADWGSPIKALTALQPTDIPDHLRQPNPELRGDEFDPNQYFTALTHISMEPGYILDYIYMYDDFGGFPILFARSEAIDRQQAIADFRQSGNTDSYLNHIKTDGTEQGYYELAALSILANQFYLYWHANYNDTRIVPDGSTLEEIIAAYSSDSSGVPMDEQTIQAARALAVEPQITFASDTVTVKLITFSKWGGFSELTYILAKDFPHTLTLSDSKVVVPYDCGILF